MVPQVILMVLVEYQAQNDIYSLNLILLNQFKFVTLHTGMEFYGGTEKTQTDVIFFLASVRQFLTMCVWWPNRQILPVDSKSVSNVHKVTNSAIIIEYENIVRNSGNARNYLPQLSLKLPEKILQWYSEGLNSVFNFQVRQ